MKKIIFIILLSAILISCKKQNANSICWYCTYGTSNGQSFNPETICNNSETMPQKYDIDGNPVNTFCTKIK